MRIPVRKTLAAAHIAIKTVTTKRIMVANISPIQISEPEESRSTITIGVKGGMNEKTRDIKPLGSLTSLNQDSSGIMKIIVIGIIRLWVSLIVLQTEPAPAMIELTKRKPKI